MIKTAQIIEGYRNGTVPSSTLIKMAAFKDELEKTAAGQNFTRNLVHAFKNFQSTVLPQLLIGGGMLGVGSAIHEGIKGLGNMYHDYKLDQDKMPSYEAMIQQHPELVDPMDPEKVALSKVYFDALWHYSPIMAQEPLSAGAYIKNAMNMHHVAQGPLPSVVKELVDISKAHHQAIERPAGEGTLGNIFMGLKTGPGAYDPSGKSKRKF